MRDPTHLPGPCRPCAHVVFVLSSPTPPHTGGTRPGKSQWAQPQWHRTSPLSPLWLFTKTTRKDRKSFPGRHTLIRKNQSTIRPGGLRGLDVKYREGGAAPGRWISTCSERLILRVILPTERNGKPSSPSPIADEFDWHGLPGHKKPCPGGLAPSSRNVAAWWAHASPHSAQVVEASICFLPSRGPVPVRRAVGTGHPKVGCVPSFVLSKPGVDVFLAVPKSFVVLERPILTCYCHRPLFPNSLSCFLLQG